MRAIQSLFSPSREDDFSAQQTLTLIGLAGVTTLLMAFIPWLHWLDSPFRLLLTIVHELGHGLAALLTGGRFISFVVYPNGAGLATTTGGWRLVVIPAGYLGVAVFGAVLILLGRSHRWARVAMAIIGGLMALLSLRYGIAGMFTLSFLSGILTTVSGVIFGAFFLWVAIKAAPGWIIFLLHLVAIQAGLTAFSDLFTVIGLSTRFFYAPANDAKSMAELTFIPAFVWAVLWAVIALVLIGGAIWVTWLAPDRKENAGELSTYRY
jgi:hypothetical protein